MVQNSKKDLIKYHPKKEGEEGFSLIELVVVVGVLAVLSAIAIPSFICFPKRARATVALAALRQIKTECALKEAEAKPEIFTSTALDGYTIQTSGSNSCAGSNGVISALPSDTNELPTFNLSSATGLLTYKFRGKTGTNFTECLGMICGDGARLASLPPNESTLFGPDSGLSCREVKSFSTSISKGNIYMSGQDTIGTGGWGRQYPIQPVKIKIGDVYWIVKDVETSIKREPYQDSQWLQDFARAAAETITKNKNSNLSEEEPGDFSAEVDPKDPTAIKIYTPVGKNNVMKKEINLEDVTYEVDYTLRGNNIYSLTDPYAIPAFEKPDQNQGKETTICDGK